MKVIRGTSYKVYPFFIIYKNVYVMRKEFAWVLLDNGHGKDTPGKSSPDGTFREYKYCREVVNSIYNELIKQGYNCIRITPEDTDISLEERVNRINNYCKKYGVKNCVLLSIHCNAAGNGKDWMNGSGWEVYTTKGVTKSDMLAELLCNEVEDNDIKLRKDTTDGDMDKETDFYIIRYSKCAAVLTENLFMDNKKDLKYLIDNQQIIIDIHVNSIKKYIDKI